VLGQDRPIKQANFKKHSPLKDQYKSHTVYIGIPVSQEWMQKKLYCHGPQELGMRSWRGQEGAHMPERTRLHP
jgi:hypothetical protein